MANLNILLPRICLDWSFAPKRLEQLSWGRILCLPTNKHLKISIKSDLIKMTNYHNCKEDVDTEPFQVTLFCVIFSFIIVVMMPQET